MEYVSLLDNMCLKKYLNLGNRWGDVVRIYYAGHWPVGFSKEKIIAI